MTLLGAVTPLIGGVGAGAVLMVIDPILTSVLAIAAALWSVLLYPFMRRQLKINDRMIQGKRDFALESRALLEASPATDVPEPLRSAVRLAEVTIGRRRMANAMKLVLQIGVAVIATLAALYLAHRIMNGGGDWPVFIVYLGGLRIALNGGFAVPRSAGQVSRFYPRLLVLIRFIQSAGQIDVETLGRAGAGDRVSLGSLPDGTDISARGGDRIALATLVKPLAVRGAFLQASAANSGLPIAAAWVKPADLSTDTDRDASILLVDYEDLALMETAEAQAWLAQIDDRVVAIVYRDKTPVGAFGEPHLVVVDDDGLTASVALGTAESDAALESFTEARARGGGCRFRLRIVDGGGRRRGGVVHS